MVLPNTSKAGPQERSGTSGKPRDETTQIRFCGPPWAPPPQKPIKEFSERNPIDDKLDALKKGLGGRISDARADFFVASLALVKGNKL